MKLWMVEETRNNAWQLLERTKRRLNGSVELIRTRDHRLADLVVLEVVPNQLVGVELGRVGG